MLTGLDSLGAVDHHCCEKELDVLLMRFACLREKGLCFGPTKRLWDCAVAEYCKVAKSRWNVKKEKMLQIREQVALR